MAQSLQEYERWHGGFPADLARTTLDDFRDNGNAGIDRFKNAASKIMTEWDGERSVGLYLWGERPGTGKTMAAVALARALHDSNNELNVVYTHLPTESHTSNTKDSFGFTSRYGYWTKEGIQFRNSSNKLGKNIGRGTVVHIIDEYRPGFEDSLHSALEANQQEGGLVVITSNFTSPFDAIEAVGNVTPTSPSEALIMDQVEHLAPEAFAAIEERRRDVANRIAEAFRSRFASSILPIEFNGDDMRYETSFWN